MIKGSTYKKLYKALGGLPTLIAVNMLGLFQNVAALASTYYIQKWAFSSPAEQHNKEAVFSLAIFGFAFLYSLMLFIRVIVVVRAAYTGSRLQHNLIL